MAIVVFGGCIAATVVGSGVPDWRTLGAWIFVGLPAAVIVRSWWFGVYVDASTVKVVSWYWTYRIDRDSLKRVTLQNYNGFATMWTGGGGTDFVTWAVLMFEFEDQRGKVREFPATAMWWRSAKTAADELRDLLGHAPYSEGARSEVRRARR
ncbi:hypothetical protein RH861_07065 [Agromyces indicus]|uniref:PH domain-containing protein n=1 Tax=Agromyces indicus TaxID=758919 RepID=A0ABU1FKF0_9MICO|nr:hypothetical protein [Agromyces indicus]